MDINPFPVKYQVLSGGGEMGNLIRAKDWSKTPVGDISEWSHSLLMTLGILLSSKFPMFLWWGPELICFYNDAYRPSLGNNGKHPSILGQPAEIAWAEIWTTIKPLIDQVMAGGESAWSEDQLIPIYRNGKMENVYWTFSYSPVKDETGDINGVLVVCNETTEKVAAIKKIAQSENNFRNLFREAPVAMSIFLGPEFIIDLANDEALRLWGKDKTVIGKTLMEAIPELEGQPYLAILQAVFTTGKTYEGKENLAFLEIDGVLQPVYVNFIYKALYDGNQNVYAVLTIGYNVTEQVENKKRIEENDYRLRIATEGSQLATWDLNLQKKEMLYSPQLAVIFGHPESAVLTQMALRNQVHPGDRHTIVEKAFESALQTGVCNYEARIIWPDKSIHWIKTLGKVIFDDAHTPLRMLGTVMDISERQSIQEKIMSLAAIVESSEDAIISKDLNGIISTWNNSAQRIFGYTAMEMIGQPVTKLIPPGRINEEIEILSRIRKDERVEHYETQRITKDNRLLDISLTISPVKDAAGNITGASKIARDITLQKQAERLISENKERLEIVINASELGTWELNVKTNEITYSRRYLEIVGYTGEKDPGHAELIQYLHPEDITARELAFKNAFKTGVLHYVSRLIWNDKSIHWIEAKGKVFYDELGQPLRLIGTARDLTEEKTYQQRVEESEQRFRAVADTAPVLIWLAAADKLCIFFNKAWLKFTGRSMEEEYGNGWTAGVHPEDFQRCLDFYTTHFDRRQEFYMEYRLKRFDGQYRWISDNGVPRFTQDGIFEGYIGACMDIHDRIIFEENLKESESRLRIAALSSELGTWDYNPLNEIMIWDSASRKLFGVAAEIPITVDLFWSKVHADDREPALQKMLRALDPDIAETYDMEYRVIGLPHDKIRWLHAKGKALFEDKKPYRFSGTVLDITEKRLALEELQANEQKFRLLSDSMPQFIWTGNEKGELNYFNRSVYEYSGLTTEQLDSGGWIQIVHPDDREENIKQWLHSVATGEPFLFEHRFRRYDGEYRWQLSRAIPKKDTDGNIQIWVGSSTDIDDMKKHDQQKDDFIKMASHELKTPVTTIKGYVQLLLKMSSSGENIFLSNSLLTIDRQVSKLTNLIGDLLDVTKIETGSLHLDKEIFNVADMVKEIAKDLQATNQTHSIVLTQHANPLIFADKDRISQVIINLFTNAIKYSPRADKILVEINSRNKMVIVSVQDFGIGITQDDYKKIFERFYRVSGKDEKTFPGFGIGLFIVNEIISLHKGEVWVKSEKDKGSVFYFSLPVHF